MTHPPTRYERGLDKLREIDGEAGEQVVASLAGIAPDFARYLIEFPFGDIYSRPGLDLRSREIAVVAALTALGNAAPQLKVHLRGALNVGVSREEIVETIMQMAVYAGFPAALNGVFAVQEVLREKGLAPPETDAAAAAASCTRDRFADGWKALQRVDGHGGEAVIASLADVAPDLGRFIIEFAFGDVYARPGLGLLERELVTIAALAAMGTAAPQLRVHLHGFLHVGGSREQMVEALVHIAAYAGFPAAINGVAMAREVLAERERRPG